MQNESVQNVPPVKMFKDGCEPDPEILDLPRMSFNQEPSPYNYSGQADALPVKDDGEEFLDLPRMNFEKPRPQPQHLGPRKSVRPPQANWNEDEEEFLDLPKMEF